MKLDTHTEKGRQHREQETRLEQFLKHSYPQLDFLHTDPDKPAALDLLVLSGRIPSAVAEIKCRNNPMEYFEERGSLLITDHKRLMLGEVSKAFHVPGYVILYSIPDDDIRVSIVTDRTGLFCYHSPTATTQTQATCNGGTAERLNAYLPWRWFRDLCVADFTLPLEVQRDSLLNTYPGSKS
jgi:hypothetical protein